MVALGAEEQDRYLLPAGAGIFGVLVQDLSSELLQEDIFQVRILFDAPSYKNSGDDAEGEEAHGRCEGINGREKEHEARLQAGADQKPGREREVSVKCLQSLCQPARTKRDQTGFSTSMNDWTRAD